MRWFGWLLLLAISCGAFPLLAANGLGTPQKPADLPGWSDDDLHDWLTAWRRSCALVPWRKARLAVIHHRKEAWSARCRDAVPVGHGALRRWLERGFEVVAVPEEALVTGYFEPRINARPSRLPPFTTPLYRLPPDRVHVARSRAEIEGGALKGRGLELAWVDPVDAFFLHIQGSGLLSLPGGKVVRAAYAGNNGHPYRAIGKDLGESGAIPWSQISMQSIRAWLRANPDQATAMMQRNPRYIYFSLSESDGPRGASGTTLTTERSVAIDPAFFPYGLPVWLDVAPLPNEKSRRLQRLAVTQDTGKAIRGPARADYFWGTGEWAGQMAGRMKARGRIYLLLPRSDVSE